MYNIKYNMLSEFFPSIYSPLGENTVFYIYKIQIDPSPELQTILSIK